MRLGAHVSTAGGPAKAFDRAVDIGAETIQIFASSPRAWKFKMPTDEQASETLTPAVQPVEEVFTVDGYTLLNANINYRFGAEEQYQVAIYGNNLTDEHFCNVFRASDTANVAAPGALGQHRSLVCGVSNSSVRTYGLSFGVEF